MISFRRFYNRKNKYLNSLVKISLLSALLFALAMSLKIGLLHGIIAGLAFSIVFTMLIAIIFIPIDYMCTAKLPLEAINVSQERDIKLKGDINSVHVYCAEAIKNINGVNKIHNKDNSNIIAFTRPTISSFGERIVLHLSQIDQETINVHILSQPLYKFSMFDYGRNYKNIECIVNQIMGATHRVE